MKNLLPARVEINKQGVIEFGKLKARGHLRLAHCSQQWKEIIISARHMPRRLGLHSVFFFFSPKLLELFFGEM